MDRSVLVRQNSMTVICIHSKRELELEPPISVVAVVVVREDSVIQRFDGGHDVDDALDS